MSGFSLGGVGVVNTPPKAKKSDRIEFTIKGVYDHAALEVLISDLKTAQADLRTDIDDKFREEMILAGCISKKRPDNPLAVELGASGSPELRKRSTASALSAEEITLCDELGIAYTEVVQTVETFVINPNYIPAVATIPEEVEAEKAKAKVMKNLEAVIGQAIKAGKLPEDIILKQNGVKRKVIADTALDTLFTLGEDVVRRGLSLCSTLSYGKTKFPGVFADALKVAERLIPAFKAKVDAAKADAKAKKPVKAAA